MVTTVVDGPTQLYIDRHLCHEVTSPQAFAGLRARGLEVYRPERTTLTADHNIPTMGQDQPIRDQVSRFQIDTLAKNANAKRALWGEIKRLSRSQANRPHGA